MSSEEVVVGICKLTIQMISKTLDPHSLEGFQEILERNVAGDFNIIRLAAKEMLSNKIIEGEERGVIINTSRYYSDFLYVMYFISVVFLQSMDRDIK